MMKVLNVIFAASQGVSAIQIQNDASSTNLVPFFEEMVHEFEAPLRSQHDWKSLFNDAKIFCNGEQSILKIVNTNPYDPRYTLLPKIGQRLEARYGTRDIESVLQRQDVQDYYLERQEKEKKEKMAQEKALKKQRKRAESKANWKLPRFSIALPQRASTTHARQVGPADCSSPEPETGTMAEFKKLVTEAQSTSYGAGAEAFVQTQFPKGYDWETLLENTEAYCKGTDLDDLGWYEATCASPNSAEYQLMKKVKQYLASEYHTDELRVALSQP